MVPYRVLERSKNAGKLAIEEVLRLRKVLGVLKERVASLQDIVMDETSDAVDVQIAIQDLDTARAKAGKLEGSIRLKEVALGVDDRQTLKHLVKSAYIQARMNARALKYRLRHKLRARKFELDRVERTYHRKKTGIYQPLLVELNDYLLFRPQTQN
jgi:hypothetical protein